MFCGRQAHIHSFPSRCWVTYKDFWVSQT
ncbi:unnamed protein product [Acanthoscelides obtectus]|uniref:Uncharacterized protein n=1 Tax=Acanthoscelides obtectus TaxID=200917 RepID=A0A9P0Q9T0_ACAOB|nr:unnamed protein product [Acanthoscelides obtectus]CAK1684902.1 hypothetical protein AOBTE_LOCUS35161 [Acanthoscelides obtectus]